MQSSLVQSSKIAFKFELHTIVENKILSFSMEPKNYLDARKKSFGYAFKGIAILFETQAHAKIHAIATVFVLVLGNLLSIGTGRWALLFLAIGLVWMAEGMNTAIEFGVDLASPQQHELAGKAKDVAAGAVLLAAIAAAICGIFIFIPPILDLLFGW